MTLTTLITLNAALGATIAYALHHLLAHGIRTERRASHEVAALPARESERIAA
jgi:hypothetical protein